MTKLSKWENHELPWLPKDDLPADPICDFKTSDNKSSVYEIDAAAPGHKKRIAVALAATKQKVDKIDYILLDKQLIDAAKIKITHSAGETPDNELNVLHRDLDELSALRLIRLVRDIFAKDVSTISDRFDAKSVAISVWQEVANGRFDRNRVLPALLTDACIKILEGLANKKLSPEDIGKEALQAVSQHYMNELKAGNLDKVELIKEAKKWIGE
jgi:hypothetical protein